MAVNKAPEKPTSSLSKNISRIRDAMYPNTVRGYKSSIMEPEKDEDLHDYFKRLNEAKQKISNQQAPTTFYNPDTLKREE